MLNFLRDNAFGPFYLARLVWDTLRLPARMARSARRADEFRYYDYGARFSVRELAAQRPTEKFMQVLDAGKYTKLLDRAVTDSIIEFLDEHGVDVSEFQQAANTVSIRNATFVGGQQSFGGKNVNVQQNAAPTGASSSTGGSRG